MTRRAATKTMPLYHAWFSTKRRKWLREGELEGTVKELIRAVAAEKRIEILLKNADGELERGVHAQRVAPGRNPLRRVEAAEAHAAHERPEQHAKRDRRGSNRQLQELLPDDLVDQRGRTAADCMKTGPTTIARDEIATRALKLMESRKITALPVVDARGRVEGLLHLHDLWRTQWI